MKKYLLPIIILSICSSLSYGQSTTQNYVLVKTYKVPSATELSGTGNVTEEIQYIDGLGRPVQSVVKKGSPSQKDIIQPIEYDIYGRVVKEYQPYTLDQGTNAGSYTASAVTEQASFYNSTIKVAATSFPFVEKVYENSSADRVLEQSAPGASWQLGAGNTVKTQFLFNVSSDDIKELSVASNGDLVIGSNYADNMLSGTVMQDEQGIFNKEYKDALGNVVMKENSTPQVTDKLRTYYVYDDFNNLRYVLPPQSFGRQADYSTQQLWLDNHAYQYKYDERQRLIYKKLPGAAPVYYVYDPMNKPILEQDGNLRSAGKWKYMRYDALGRVIETGVCTLNSAATSAPTASTHRISSDERITSSYFPTPSAGYFANFTNFYEERACGSATGYTDYTFPSSSAGTIEVYTRNYYDDYDYSYCKTVTIPISGTPYLEASSTAQGMFDGGKGTDYAGFTDSRFAGNEMTLRVKGLPTYSEVKILDASGDKVLHFNFYDAKSRPVQTQEQRNDGAKDEVINTVYDFEGKPVLVQHHNSNTPASSEHKYTDKYEYDHGNRLTNHYFKVDNADPVLLANSGYNELSQLTEKYLHHTTGNNYLQYTDYRYNERGWLRKINDDVVAQNAILAGINNDFIAAIEAIHVQYVATTITEQEAADQTIAYVMAQLNSTNTAIANTMWNSVSALVLPDPDNITYADVYNGINTVFANNLSALAASNASSEPGMNNTNDLFDETLRYDVAPYDITPQYNGNIASVSWYTANDKTKIKRYQYKYYYMNWLRNADYSEDFACTSGCTGDQYNEFLGYDLNGNIISLERTGLTGIDATTTLPTFGMMDNLAYTYKGNQVQSVNDAVTSNATPLQFLDNGSNGSLSSPEYAYDANGNMDKDDNKGISSITYNTLNLPKLITFTNGGTIEFTYDGTGQKLQKKVTDANSTVTTKYYLGSEEYTNNTLEAYYHGEGRITPKPSNAWQYEYTLKDHLGNGRVYFADLNNDGTVDANNELLQVQDYYAFGLQHSRIGSSLIGVQNKYQYNGKEFDDELGLNWNDYGARNYMADISRWSCADPLAEKVNTVSPYDYVNNNPERFIDLDGNEFTEAALTWIEKLGVEINDRQASNTKTIENIQSRGNLNRFEKRRVENLKQNNVDLEKYRTNVAELGYSTQVYDVKENFSSSNNNQDEKSFSPVGETTFDRSNGNVVIKLYKDDVVNFAHELQHAYQFEKGKESYGNFRIGNKYPGFLLDKTDELNAYKINGLFGETTYNSIDALPSNYNVLGNEGTDITNYPGTINYLSLPLSQQKQRYQDAANKLIQAFRVNGITYYKKL